MAPKRAIWKRMPKWWFKFIKRKARPVITRPHFSPELPNEERCNQLNQYVVRLVLGDAAGYYTYLPAICIRVHQGSHCLIFESTLIRQLENSLHKASIVAYALSFPNELDEVDVPKNAFNEMAFDDGLRQRIRLTALSYDTDENQCPAIHFGERVVVGQRLFLYDLRRGSPSLVEGNVTCVGEVAFVLDAKWHKGNLLGALVFDETNCLVGLVYHHEGSAIAIHNDRLREHLLTFFPGTQNMGEFHRNIQQSTSWLWDEI
ncbi:hypothetical protein ACQ4PT_020233 [Festuca glaucescens]